MDITWLLFFCFAKNTWGIVRPPTKGVTMDELTKLTREVGANIEATGRMLQRKPVLTYEDLTRLRDTLNYGAETVQNIRDIEVENHS